MTQVIPTFPQVIYAQSDPKSPYRSNIPDKMPANRGPASPRWARIIPRARGPARARASLGQSGDLSAEHQVPHLPRKSHRQSGGDEGTPCTSDPLQSTKCRTCHRQSDERRRPRDARAYIGPLAERQVRHLPRKSHRQSGRDQGTPGRTSEPLAVHIVPRLPRKSHRQSGGDEGTPGRTSDPLAVHQVPTMPRQSGGDQGTPGCTSDPLAVRQVPHLPRKSHRQSGGDQGTPGRTSDPLQTQKPPAEQRRPRDARAYIRPLAEHRKSHWQSGGEQATPGRTSDPLQSTKCCACHAKATGRAAETKGRQGVHPTPSRAPSAAPATQKPPEERRRPRDARAYIRPLAEHQVPRLPSKTKGRQGVHPTPCRAPSAAPATQKPPAERRRPRDARAYIRPSAAFATQKPPARAYDPLQSTKCRTCHAKATGDQGTPGRTSDPLQSTKCHACHAKE